MLIDRGVDSGNCIVEFDGDGIMLLLNGESDDELAGTLEFDSDGTMVRIDGELTNGDDDVGTLGEREVAGNKVLMLVEEGRGTESCPGASSVIA